MQSAGISRSDGPLKNLLKKEGGRTEARRKKKEGGGGGGGVTEPRSSFSFYPNIMRLGVQYMKKLTIITPKKICAPHVFFFQ